jgi:hypothetical protein
MIFYLYEIFVIKKITQLLCSYSIKQILIDRLRIFLANRSRLFRNRIIDTRSLKVLLLQIWSNIKINSVTRINSIIIKLISNNVRTYSKYSNYLPMHWRIYGNFFLLNSTTCIKKSICVYLKWELFLLVNSLFSWPNSSSLATSKYRCQGY